jgi:hypothetical protein
LVTVLASCFPEVVLNAKSQNLIPNLPRSTYEYKSISYTRLILNRKQYSKKEFQFKFTFQVYFLDIPSQIYQNWCVKDVRAIVEFCVVNVWYKCGNKGLRWEIFFYESQNDRVKTFRIEFASFVSSLEIMCSYYFVL